MTSIAPLPPGLAASASARPRGRTGATGFAVADADTPLLAATIGETAELSDCQLGLLSLQDDGIAADEPSRRRARGLLARLTALQLRLLGCDAIPAAVLATLRAELSDLPIPDDARLAAVLASIVLRVEVELARHEQPT